MDFLLGLIGGPEGAIFAILSKGWKLIGAAFSWVFASITNFLATACVLIALFAAWEYRRADHADARTDKVAAVWGGAYDKMRQAYVLERGQAEDMANVVRRQDQAIVTFQHSQEELAENAEKAYRAAIARAAHAEKDRDRIKAQVDAMDPNAPDCPGLESVTQGKGSL